MDSCGFEEFKKKVEQGIGRSISKNELVETMDDPKIIDTIVRRAVSLNRRIDKNSCFNIDGWTVRLSFDGYYRMYKTIEGRTESLYLGKSLDFKKARRKIAKKEKELGVFF
ncbi:MAG: hypothetical protein DRI70_09045 [Bacteroidetes bacterium]|nr:MAG: hypothetical protein DRI70_09045 [Bacteroidota bacterium]